jgi:CBS domain-containing protein
MITAAKPLLSLVAADLMSPAPITIPQEMSLEGAARMLARANISGAPVVDAQGRCVGVLSAHDFLCWAERGSPAAKNRPVRSEGYCSAWQISAVEGLPDEAVRNYMTADPVTVPPGETIGVMARMMVDAHIHRLIVLDRASRPIGIVSSTDVLAAVARAAEGDGEHT